MKLTAILFALTTIVSVSAISASDLHTNADRLRHGFPPLPPRRRGTPVLAARQSKPSGIHNSCNTGSVQCCNSVTHADSGMANVLESLFGVVVAPNTAVGVTCHPLSPVGIGGNHCQQQTVCCENNRFNGLVAIGCSPINING